MLLVVATLSFLLMDPADVSIIDGGQEKYILEMRYPTNSGTIVSAECQAVLSTYSTTISCGNKNFMTVVCIHLLDLHHFQDCSTIS